MDPAMATSRSSASTSSARTWGAPYSTPWSRCIRRPVAVVPGRRCRPRHGRSLGPLHDDLRPSVASPCYREDFYGFCMLRFALDKKKVEEKKTYQAIDYDAPVESDKSTIGFGTRVGIGIAVVVFGLVFTIGDFLPYGSDSPSKESTVVNKQLSEEEKTHFERTLEGFEETLAKSPYDPAALQGAAVSLVELGEYEKASGLLEKLVKVIPDKAEAYRLLGEVKIELQDYEGSSSSYRNSLSSSDNIDFEVLRGLTNSLVAAKKPDQAVEVILSCRRKLNEKSQIPSADRKAANDNGAQKPKDIDPIQVDLLLGKTYSDWGRISDAVTVYDKLITEHPEDFRGYLAKGIILKQNGKAGEAERMFIQAKFFAPEAAKALVDIYAQR